MCPGPLESHSKAGGLLPECPKNDPGYPELCDALWPMAGLRKWCGRSKTALARLVSRLPKRLGFAAQPLALESQIQASSVSSSREGTLQGLQGCTEHLTAVSLSPEQLAFSRTPGLKSEGCAWSSGRVGALKTVASPAQDWPWPSFFAARAARALSN